MKKLFPLLLVLFLAGPLAAQQKTNTTVKGIVTHQGEPLANAVITSDKFETEVKTNAKGQYSIQTKEGDMIKFSYPGMRDMEIVVEDVTAILNIRMNAEVNQLREVVVEKTKIKSQNQLRAEYSTNKNLINTAFGILDKDITNFSVKIIEGKDLLFGGIDLVSAIQYRFAGVRVDRPAADPQNPIVYLRGNSLGFFPAIYDVDGLILTDTPTFVMVENIERIAILRGLGLVAKYGGQANGGVIVINTKGANTFVDPVTGGPFDQARLRNNIFENDAISLKQVSANDPTYLKELKSASTIEEAKSIYEEQTAIYKSSYHFVLDSYLYFKSVWGGDDFAEEILKSRKYLFNDNPVALKALAYIYQADGAYEKANEVFKELFILRPNYAQSYRDLALSYRQIRDYRKAAALYTRYDYLVEQGFIRQSDLGFTPVISREFWNLIGLHRDQLVQSKPRAKRSKEKDFKGTRLVFEWSDSEAEFELQFVNPENQYYNWEHSLLANAERIKDEKLKGYSCEEYLIDDSLKGVWKVNVKYLGNKSLTPTYLKVTAYYNYGTRNQQEDTKVFKLGIKDTKQQLLTFNNYSQGQTTR